MEQLGSVTPAQLPQLLHRVVDELAGKTVPLAANPEEKKLRVACGRYIASVVSRELKRELLLDELQKQFSLAAPIAEAVAEVVFARWAEVRSGAAATAARGAQLADVDWRVHALVAAERLSQLRSARLVLDLHVLEPAAADAPQQQQQQQAPLRLELTKQDVDRLLADLAACNAHVQRLKT